MINGLEKVFIIYDEEKGKYSVQYQYKGEVWTLQSNIDDVKSAKMIKYAYTTGLYDGKNNEEE